MSLNHKLFTMLLLSSAALLVSCNSDKENRSLAELDVSTATETDNKVFIRPKTREEVRQAYSDYLDNADLDDNSRIDALNRLAELEFSESNKLRQEQEDLRDDTARQEALEDKRYEQRLNSTIKLLTTSLRDYPKAKNNDTLLYQLAKAYDQKGDHQASNDSLTRLVEQYPKSQFYTETQFRIAEDAFSLQDYSTAEFSYTEVILARGNEIFYEKALFKRGWARFKQQYYIDAVDDFLQAVLEHDFVEFEKLDKSEREQFDEYFRAVGLAFSYLGGSEPLHDYFRDRPDFIYTYHTYSMVSDIYLKQERYSDAVDTLKQFIKYYPESDNIPYSHLKIINIWKDSGFTQKIYDAIEDFYVAYNPSSTYWKDQNENSRVNRAIRRSLKEYVVLMTGYYHNRYQDDVRRGNKKPIADKDYVKAELWYKRYLKDYSSYAQQDNIYFLYAELLSQKKRYREALRYYELAAYDNDIIIHKDAAYASIIVSDKLLNTDKNDRTLLNKNIRYAVKYSQRYPDDKRTHKLILHVAELAYRSGQYKSAIELADVRISHSKKTDSSLTSLKAESYFKLEEYAETESIYLQLLRSKNLASKQRRQYSDRLALAIYKQGEQSLKEKDTAAAIHHYSRIVDVAPASAVAATGLYDAIALNMQHKQWKPAIREIKQFQKLYPKNKRQTDVSKKLSVAYLSSDQGIKAAQEFEKMSSMGDNLVLKTAALWQAAELYEEKNKINSAIKSYEKYARTYKKPYAQNMEAMQKLTELYTERDKNKKDPVKNSNRWRLNIVNADKKALNNSKTERTRYITSFAYLGLARSEMARFNWLKLTLPLNKSLRKKKTSMQKAVKLYGYASKYKVYEASTEATYSIALIYKNFSKALLDSDRPKSLNAEELDQYEILLEDQAFPFEDKAIEFFEINLARVQDGLYNSWIQKSLHELTDLFPARYARKPKTDSYVNILH
ncbi:MAG: tetratricopeptide repeat protein [Proteobacteria bacterium]|nr:tetratricopeptide repeat protein [Pseudomonadota bacterium]